MLRWLTALLKASIGKKLVMAVSGLLLIGFLVVHLSGNLLLYVDAQGATFNSYGRAMDENPLIPIAEIGLFALFVIHIVFALRVSLENREARRERYSVRASSGASTFASSTMVITGIIVLLFLLVHLWDFRIGKLMAENREAGLAALVRRRLSEPWVAGLYLLGVIALGVHLRHAFRSAFQTLGASHPRLDPLLVKLSIALAILFTLGFASFPLFFWFGGSTP
jgi:succinate dehydrogenase / fumarate reductase cytochrome b subunit